jgi:ribosomal-protein-serine acetyltransferase
MPSSFLADIPAHIPMPIRTPRLLIRPILPEDASALNLAALESFADLTQWLPWAEHRPSLADSEKFARESYAKWLLREQLRMSIFDSKGKNFLGCLGLYCIDWKIPKFEIGYWLRTSGTGQGYMTEAINALTRYAFAELKAKRLEIRCDFDNHKSAKIATRLGFHFEAHLKCHALKPHGQGITDTLIFARLSIQELPALDVSWDQKSGLY